MGLLNWVNGIFKNSESVQVPFIGISRHRIVTDGDGVTTLVAFHGCELNCKYCLNPQSLQTNGVWRKFTPQSLLQAVLIDNLYFDETGGGICFGGGEPLMHTEFIKAFKSICPNSWKISVETSLNVSKSSLIEIADFVDSYIVDIKDMNPFIYSAYTGKDNSKVKENLRWLVANGLSDRITIRTPLIPSFNTQSDVDLSVAELKSMGFMNFENLTYITERHKKDSTIEEIVGKATCFYLKNIRIDVAKRQGIAYSPKECTHKGPCAGTCPVCDNELKCLNQLIYQRIN